MTRPAAKLSAILSACGLAAGLVVTHEGWVPKTYNDPVGIPTACAGVTEGVIPGRVYSDDECVQLTAAAMVKHGVGIDRCIKVEIPVDTRAAFTSFAYNVGVENFCGSTAAKRLNAGDAQGACAELSRWVYAGGKQLPGLVRRRAAERSLCEKGLHP